MRGSMVLCLFALFVGVSARGAVVPDLTAVEGIEQYHGSDDGKRLLRENGFVVVPEYQPRTFTVYDQKKLPKYITVDSVFETFHVLLEKELENLDAALSARTQALTDTMAEALRGTSEPGAKLAVAYFQVASHLFKDTDAGTLDPTIRSELALIREAAQVAKSPLFGYAVDYTQFKPRGLYARSAESRAYFRGVSWYGVMAFRLKSPEETASACLIARTLAATPGAVERWRSIDFVHARLLGPCDDLTPLEYADALVRGGTPASALAGLRNPKVNSMVLSPEQAVDWVNETKGMRFLGKRYLIDGEVFMAVTTPALPGRAMVSGLDLMAANGWPRALELAKQDAGDLAEPYAAAIAKVAPEVAQAKQGPMRTHYGAFLRLVDALSRPAPDKAPAFAKTAAYSDKNLMTALSSWASERHTFVLQAKQSAVPGGIGAPPRLSGYVEPNDAFYVAMQHLIGQTIWALYPVHECRLNAFFALAKLNLQLREMARKELAGAPFDDAEQRLLDDYADTIAAMQDSHVCGGDPVAYPLRGLVSDVHSRMDTNECLEAATGGAMPIYVVVERGGKSFLCLGGVTSYFEFVQPIAGRLTDATWQEQWRPDRRKLVAPRPLPAWTASFVAPPSRFAMSATAIADLIEAVRRGEKPDLLPEGPVLEFDSFLANAVKLGGELTGKVNHQWALSLAAKRLGRSLIPTLFELLRTAPSGYAQAPNPQAAKPLDCHDVASEFRYAVTLEDLPTLREIAENDPKRASAVLYAASLLDAPRVQDFLATVASRTRSPEVRQKAIAGLSRISDVDRVPQLLDLILLLEPREQAHALERLADIWHPNPSARKRFPSALSVPERQAIFEQYRKAVRAFIEMHQTPGSDIDAYMLKRLQEAIS